jgi:glycine betaine/proline transport system substrate-binding protein
MVLAACGGDDDASDDTTDEATTEQTDDPAAEPTDESTDDTGEMVEARMIADADTANCTPAAEAAPIADPTGTGDDETTVNVGVFSGWDENAVVFELFRAAAEEQGYTVEFSELEAGATYEGVANGDFDIMMDAWLPGTHGANYVDMDSADGAQLGDSLEDLGCWFDEGFLTVTVTNDSPAQSLAELNDFADDYDSTIVGIEPGAGLTRTVREGVIPTYGLDDWDFPESSSAAMLAELDSASNSGENIVVTLWHPHWAYAAYDIRDLEDPDGTLGGAERLYSLGRPGFTEEFPNLAQLMKNLHVTDEQLLELEDIMVVQNDREDNTGSVQQWLSDNPDFLENWRAGTL